MERHARVDDIDEWLEHQLPRIRRKVANAEGMKADVFYHHVRLRHPEQEGEKRVAYLRDQHRDSHRLIPLVLDHYHDAESGLDAGAVPG